VLLYPLLLRRGVAWAWSGAVVIWFETGVLNEDCNETAAVDAFEAANITAF
jgi:hypothetical protein